MVDSGYRIYGINGVPGIFVREKMAIGGKMSILKFKYGYPSQSPKNLLT